MSVAAPTTIDLDAVRVKHLMDVAVELIPAKPVRTPVGTRLTYVLKGGVVEGDRVRGRVLPGGGDWIVMGSDGNGRMDIRGTIETDDGELIYANVFGVVSVPEDAVARLGEGERIPWDQIYLRSSPRFETGAKQYGWLNSVVGLGIHELGPSDAETFRVTHHFFELI
jgi:hypothetical protein